MSRIIWLLLLFLPTVNFYLHIILIAILWSTRLRFTYNQLTLLLLAMIITMFRIALNPNLLETYEFIKYLTITVILFGLRISSRNASYVILVAGIVNLVGVFLQWSNPYHPFWKELVGVLYTENHYYGSMLRSSPRAPGFMTNIIEVSVLFFACTVILKERFLISSRKWEFILLVAFMLGLLLSQSKTVIILSLTYWLWYVIKRFRYRSMLPVGGLAIIILRSGILNRVDQLARLSNPLEVTSLLSRLNIWFEIWRLSMSNVSFFAFGMGRLTFESVHGEIPLDNDIMIMMLNFGVIGIGSYLIIIKDLSSKTAVQNKSLIVLFLGMGLMISVLFNIKTLIIYLLLFQALKKDEDSVRLRQL